MRAVLTYILSSQTYKVTYADQFEYTDAIEYTNFYVLEHQRPPSSLAFLTTIAQ
jgi:hypothetical protein